LTNVHLFTNRIEFNSTTRPAFGRSGAFADGSRDRGGGRFQPNRDVHRFAVAQQRQTNILFGDVARYDQFEFPFTEAVSFQIYCEDQSEVDRLWSALADGGCEVACGWIKDRWGLSWQIVPTRLIELLNDPDTERARRTHEAMMQMVKIDIAALERAADAKG
jgi:predicted 3-demethylubiquinone-9 3-methyltransferase (glyoxalase superfamily)